MEWNFVDRYLCERITAHQGPERLDNFIEEILYVFWELSPTDRLWRYDLAETGKFKAHYCDEHFIVIVNKPTRIVEVVRDFGERA